jgi:capsular exopolysaccharide synthesis family protein
VTPVGPNFLREATTGLPPATRATLVWHPQCPPRSTEQFRRLAHALYRLRVERQSRVIGITSARPEEGKTLTSVNVAVSLAESYRQRVLLIDADLRRPNIAALLNLPVPDGGLTQWLARQNDVECPMLRISPRLSIVTSAPADQDPVALLSSIRMALLLATARSDFDWVIIDTPPAGLLCDAGVIDTSVDGFLMVVAAGHTHAEEVTLAIDMMGRDRLLGMVLNRVTDRGKPAHDPYAVYYAEARNPRPRL